METYCTRPNCPRPTNVFPDLDDRKILKTVQQKFCTACGMPQILIGRYVPTRLLGRGGFGTAFLAIDRYTPTMRKCVVKQFQPSGNLPPDQLELAQQLFEREAEALESLGNPHPQIPDLLAFFELSVPTKGTHQPSPFFYLVQEFIDGQNMEEELAQKGKFSQSEALEVFGEVLKILKFVHDHGSIHRDIKPSNIMRDRNGRIYLLDFGAVKLVTSTQGGSPSQRSTGIYSLGFAPPEQMSGGVVYPATDLYALAVTVITLLTGKQPMELYDAYTNTWNWRAYVQVNDLLEAVLNRMLLPTPSDRFQSVEEVTAALKRSSATPSAPSSSGIASSASVASGQGTPPPASAGGRASGTSIQPPSPPSPPSPTPSPPVSPLAKPAAAQPAAPVSSSKLLDDPFSVVVGASFVGFELVLVAIASFSFLSVSMSLGVMAIATVILAVLLMRRIIEKVDLFLLSVLSLLIALAFEIFSDFALLQIATMPFVALVMLPFMGGLIFFAASILFLLIYSLLTRYF